MFTFSGVIMVSPAQAGSAAAKDGGSSRIFCDLSSEEMKQQMASELEKMSKSADIDPRAMKIRKKGFENAYECKLLAEQYFSATDARREEIADPEFSHVARNVPYAIEKTMCFGVEKLTMPNNGLPTPESMLKDFETLPNYGTFRVRPADGKDLEQYKFTFGVRKNGAHFIEKVEKDASFDAKAYELGLVKEEAMSWGRSLFKDVKTNQELIRKLPLGDYAFLGGDTVEVRVGYGDYVSLPEPENGKHLPDGMVWQTSFTIQLRYAEPRFWTSENLLIRMEKVGDGFSLVSCRRNEEYARMMLEHVPVAEFIKKFIEADPVQRDSWRLKRIGWYELPAKENIASYDYQSLALTLQEEERNEHQPPEVTGIPSSCKHAYTTIVNFKEKNDPTGKRRSRYKFLIGTTEDPQKPFVLLKVYSPYP
jgi:hypothetical protein